MNRSSCRWMFPLVALFTAPVHATTYYVTAGDDMTLGLVLATSSPSSLVIINQPPGTGYAPFIIPVTLNPNNSQTKILAAPDTAAIWDVNGDVFTISAGTYDVVLEGLVIRGDFNGSGVQVEDDSSVKLINDQITAKFNGIHVGSNPGGGLAGLVEVEGSRIFNTNFGIVLGIAGRATVERTQIRNNDWAISQVEQGSQIKVWHSIVDANRSYGVFVGTFNDAVLNNNDISFNGLDGVFFAEGSRGSVSFNTVTYNQGAGINNLSALVNGSPGNNTIAGNSPNVVGIPVASNQIGPF